MSTFDAKISFLQDEISLLKGENRDLKQLHIMNKEIICLLTQNQSIVTQSESLKQLNSVIHAMEDESNQLHLINESLIKQRDEFRSQVQMKQNKVLLLEQIRIENSSKILEIQSDKQKKLVDLQNSLISKDNQIAEQSQQLQELLQKRKQRTRISAGVQGESLLLQNQLEAMNVLLMKYYTENQLFKQENKKLSTLLDVLNIQQEQGQGSNNDSIDILPQKVTSCSSKQLSVPKLNLGMAQKIQKLTVEKQAELEEAQNQQEKVAALDYQKQYSLKSQTPNSGKMGQFISPNKMIVQLSSLAEQNKNLQKDLSICKSKLQNELLLTKALENKLDEVQRYILELESTNDTLIKSYLRSEQHIQKLKQFIIKGKVEQPPKRHKYNVSIQIYEQQCTATNPKRRCNSVY